MAAEAARSAARHAVYQQTRRWLKAGCFEAVAGGLRVLLGVLAGYHWLAFVLLLPKNFFAKSA